MNLDIHEESKPKLITLDGIQCYTLEQLLAQKLKLGRNKDKADINVINMILALQYY